MGEWLSETEDTSMGLQSLLLTGRSGLPVRWTHAGLSRSPPSVSEVSDVLWQTGVESAVPVSELLVPWSSFAPLAELCFPRTFFLLGSPDEMRMSSVGCLVCLLGC